jgi:formylglycine-generating enzyme required for sulfatase activity
MKKFFKICVIFSLFFIVPFLCHAADQPYTNPLGMTFVPIKDGTFMMGSPKDEPGRNSDENQAEVEIDSFYMQSTEVTQAQWEAVMGSNPSLYKKVGTDGPVERVSWNDVDKFIKKLNDQGFGTYALPTEAQWEYAARGGNSETAYPGVALTEAAKCEKVDGLSDIAWYCYNGDNTTHAVKNRKKNPFDLYDMHGNVGEWVAGWYGEYPLSDKELKGEGSGFYRVYRGGSFDDYATACRSARRSYKSSDYSNKRVGFRLVFNDMGTTHCTYDISSSDDQYTPGDKSITVSDTGDTILLSVDANNHCQSKSGKWGAWIISPEDGTGEDDEWVTLTRTINETVGGGTVAVEIEKNKNDDRSAKIMVAGKQLTINQESFKECSYTVSPTDHLFSPGSQTILVEVAASSPECAWTVSLPDSLEKWARVSPRSGTGDGTVEITVNQNSGDARQETLTIAEQTIDIAQGSQSDCLYNPQPTRQKFTATGTSSLVSVIVSPDNCPWKATSNNPEWLRVHPDGNQNIGHDMITLSVTPNKGGAREGSVTIAEKEFSITQDAAPVSGLTTTQVSRLYAAIFGRASDGQGNAFWQKQPDSASAAEAILDTPDAKDYFEGSLDTNQAFIEHIYSNTLGKTLENDPDGIAFWVEQLEGGASRGQVVAALVDTIESYAPGQPDHPNADDATNAAFNQFTNRVTVSDYMAEEKFLPARIAETFFGQDGLNVTREVATVQAAKTKVDELETLDPGEDDPGEDDPGEDDPGDEPTNEFGMIFKKITAGTFQMGSPVTELGRDPDETQQEIILEHDFFIQTTEVTQGQWKAVMEMEDNPSYFDDCGDDCPVENVSWNDVQGFIARLNEQGADKYRLPSEAEWEYAARAGTVTPFSRDGVDEQKQYCDYDQVLNGLMWYCANSEQKTHPVGQRNRNWGLADMHGNVSEWVFDLYPEPPEDYAIIRGGSWRSFAHECRSAARDSRWMDYKAPDIGFRLIYEPAADSNPE